MWKIKLRHKRFPFHVFICVPMNKGRESLCEALWKIKQFTPQKIICHAIQHSDCTATIKLPLSKLFGYHHWFFRSLGTKSSSCKHWHSNLQKYLLQKWQLLQMKQPESWSQHLWPLRKSKGYLTCMAGFFVKWFFQVMYKWTFCYISPESVWNWQLGSKIRDLN